MTRVTVSNVKNALILDTALCIRHPTRYNGSMTENARSTYRKNNRSTENARMRSYMERLRERAHAIFGAVCSTCGNDDHRVLEIHHANGDGAEERKTAKNMRQRLMAVIDKQGYGYQLLCANCHRIKEWENRH